MLLDSEVRTIYEAIKAELARQADEDELYFEPGKRTASQTAMVDGYLDLGALATAIVERRAHKTMTPEEYAAMPIIGWHEVCRDVDGCGGVGIRYLGESK